MSEPRFPGFKDLPDYSTIKSILSFRSYAKPRNELKNTFRALAKLQNSFKTPFRSLRYHEINSKHAFAMVRAYDAHFQFHAYCLNQDWQQENNLVAAQSLRFVSQDYRINRINQINSSLNIGRIGKSCKSGFRQQAATKHFESIIRDAAERLKIVFNTYGNLAIQPLNEETSAIYNILQELEGKYAREAETVGIKQWVAELKKRNTALSDLMKDRFDESASKSDIVVKEARAELDKAYRTIAEKIDALVIVEGAKAYENFIRTWNAVIDKYAISLKRNKTSSQPKEVPNEQI